MCVLIGVIVANFVDIEVNARDAIIGMSVTAKKGMQGLKDYLENAGQYAQRSMLIYVTGELRRKIMGPVKVKRISPRKFEVTVGARGPSKFPLYVHEGTGLYRDIAPSMITARHDRHDASVISTRRARRPGPSGVMRFRGRGGQVIFRREVEGQRANPFAAKSYRKTTLYAKAQAERLGAHIATRE